MSEPKRKRPAYIHVPHQLSNEERALVKDPRPLEKPIPLIPCCNVNQPPYCGHCYYCKKRASVQKSQKLPRG